MGNLAYSVTEEDISDFFRDNQVNCLNVRIPRDPSTDTIKGFGYAEFDTVDDLKKALSLNGQVLHLPLGTLCAAPLEWCACTHAVLGPEPSLTPPLPCSPYAGATAVWTWQTRRKEAVALAAVRCAPIPMTGAEGDRPTLVRARIDTVVAAVSLGLWLLVLGTRRSAAVWWGFRLERAAHDMAFHGGLCVSATTCRCHSLAGRWR